MAMKPEAAAKLDLAAKLKEKGSKIINLVGQIKKLEDLENEKKKITNEIVELLGNELASKKTMNIDFPDVNKRVIIVGRDTPQYPESFKERMKMESDKIKSIAEKTGLTTYERSYYAKVEEITKIKKK